MIFSDRSKFYTLASAGTSWPHLKLEIFSVAVDSWRSQVAVSSVERRVKVERRV